MNRIMGSCLVQFCCVACAFAAEAREWIPGPSAIHFGVVVDGHLLSYQWEPAPHIQAHQRRSSVISEYLTPPERWSAPRPGEIWEPKDIRWFWADLERGDVKPLTAAKPDEGQALSQRGIFWAGWRPHNAPHRWRVGGGYFWGTGGANNPSWLFKMLRMHFVVGKAPARAESSATRDSESAQLPGKQATDPRQSPEDAASWQVEVPFGGAFGDANYPRRVLCLASDLAFVNGAFRRGAHEQRHDFDFIVQSANHLVLVALVNGRVTVGDYRLRLREKSAEATSWTGEWRRRVDFFDVPFSEPFHVAMADAAFFFVTDSGAVYMAEHTKGEWKTRAVWKDEKRPIIAMLGESDSPGAFVFGKDFFFRLAREVKPKPCEDVTKGRPDLADPMRTVFQCGRVLYTSGELKKADTGS